MDNRNSRQSSRARRVRQKKLLLLIWSMFLILLVGGIILFLNNKDRFMEDLGLKDKNTTQDSLYAVDAVPEINKLIRDYYTAYASCDQKALKSMVVDPSQFDDMFIIEKKAEIVTAYDNIKVYTIPGLTDDATIVYVRSNLSIVNVISKPLDMSAQPLYVVKKNEKYLIDNTTLSSEVRNRIDELGNAEEIIQLLKEVKDDQEKCAAEDETFRDFYNRLWQ